MFRFEADLKVFVHREPIDFRAGINSLVMLVEQSMQLDPFARAVFTFHNRRRNRVKLLFYERAGFWLMLRRLEQDHFVWPRREQTVIELNTEQLHWLLDGMTLMPCAATRRGAIATRAERQAFSLNRSAPRGYKLT